MHKARSVPRSRLSRLTRLASLTGKIGSNMLIDKSKALISGEDSDKKTLLMSAKNIQHLAKELANLRGAAMKLGQLLSMDNGELLPPELASLLSGLQAHASPMPHKQLVALMQNQFGDDWLFTFSSFELNAFAAASIGQVHKACSASGEQLAIKIQYPGVASSVNSDVDNLVSLVKISGLLPKELDIKPLIQQAKQQLLIETDYQQEAFFLQRYQQLLVHDPRFIVPNFHPEFSCDHTLCMQFIAADAIDQQVDLPQAERNNIITCLLDLFFQELLTFKLIQSDPNFANYQYQRQTQKIVLLDFGASRDITASLSQNYQQLLCSALIGDRSQLLQSAKAIGYFSEAINNQQQQTLVDLFILACEPIRFDGDYDFANSDLAYKIKQQSLLLSTDKDYWHTPPIEAMLIHRKLAGLYLLAAKLSAKVNVKQLFLRHTDID